MKPILIVDDNRQNRYLLSTLLGGSGYDVIVATNGTEALDMARTTPPVLIVADVLMPVMDGFTLCRRWMNDPVLRKIPFVFYTATYTDSKDEQFALDLGAVRFIAKPCDPETVVAEVRSVLQEAEAGTLVPRPVRAPEEAVFLKQYNEALVRKLETKMLQLEEANRAVEESNRLRLGILDSISDAFLAVDTRWRLAFFNKRAEQLLRRALPEPRELVGTRLQEAFPALLPTIPELALETVPEVLPRAPFEVYFPPTDGWYSIHGYRSAEGLSVFFHDITERKLAAQAMQRLNDELELRVQQRTAELEIANRELETFNYSVSHDLRAPLRAINGFGRILMEDYAATLPAEAADLVQRIHSNTAHMAQLIDALLELSRVTRAELHVQPVDVSAMVGTILDKLRKAHPERVVETIIAPQVSVEGDANLLRAALDNLLSNAWKFTSGHPTARIEFGVTQRDGRQVCFVRDDGAGFDRAYADKLFRPFRRLHSSEEFEGTGIGLATVKRVIERHGGSVWSESAVEKGATFYFFIAEAAAGPL